MYDEYMVKPNQPQLARWQAVPPWLMAPITVPWCMKHWLRIISEWIHIETKYIKRIFIGGRNIWNQRSTLHRTNIKQVWITFSEIINTLSGETISMLVHFSNIFWTRCMYIDILMIRLRIRSLWVVYFIGFIENSKGERLFLRKFYAKTGVESFVLKISIFNQFFLNSLPTQKKKKNKQDETHTLNKHLYFFNNFQVFFCSKKYFIGNIHLDYKIVSAPILNIECISSAWCSSTSDERESKWKKKLITVNIRYALKHLFSFESNICTMNVLKSNEMQL